MPVPKITCLVVSYSVHLLDWFEQICNQSSCVQCKSVCHIQNCSRSLTLECFRGNMHAYIHHNHYNKDTGVYYTGAAITYWCVSVPDVLIIKQRENEIGLCTFRCGIQGGGVLQYGSFHSGGAAVYDAGILRATKLLRLNRLWRSYAVCTWHWKGYTIYI